VYERVCVCVRACAQKYVFFSLFLPGGAGKKETMKLRATPQSLHVDLIYTFLKKLCVNLRGGETDNK
jgi:hypothetical protein